MHEIESDDATENVSILIPMRSDEMIKLNPISNYVNSKLHYNAVYHVTSALLFSGPVAKDNSCKALKLWHGQHLLHPAIWHILPYIFTPSTNHW